MPELFFEVYSGKSVLSGIAVLYISLATLFFPSRTRYYLNHYHSSNKQIMGRGRKARVWKGDGGELIIVVLVSWSSMPNRPWHVSRLCPSVHKAPNPYIKSLHRQCTSLSLLQKTCSSTPRSISQSPPLPRSS